MSDTTTTQIMDALANILKEFKTQLQNEPKPQPTLDGEAKKAADTFREISLGLKLKFPPIVPGKFSAKATSANDIELYWNDPTNNADGYKLRRAEGVPHGNFSEIDSFVPSSLRSHQDKGLTPGTTYHYKIVAFNAYGESESKAIPVTTK